MALEHVGSSTRRKAARKALTAAELEALASGGAGMARLPVELRYVVEWVRDELLLREPGRHDGESPSPIALAQGEGRATSCSHAHSSHLGLWSINSAEC